MAYEDELLITYGLGYAFEKSKLLIVSELEEKTVLKKELDIMKEINIINEFKEKLHSESDLRFPKSYITNVEEALEEKLSKTIPIITSIKAKNMTKQDHLMDEYIKKDLSLVRLRKEGYIQKDLTLIKEYLDKCTENLDISIENKEQKALKFDKIVLKIILTSSFGNDFSSFLSQQGQAGSINKLDKAMEKHLEDALKNKYLVIKKYNELDFLNLLLFLEEWQGKHFEWDEKYTSLLFSVNKDGQKYKGPQSEIKDYVISFIKEKRYLYFPFGKYNEENIFITLNDEKYCNKAENQENTTKPKYMVLEKKEGNLYQITSNDYKEIDLSYNYELGYLLSYENDNVNISFVTYDKINDKVNHINKYDDLKTEMIKALEEHFII
ncbi:hypothetical protein [Clostridium sp.]|uniref:hypothetical protein n=1 Tax=Clostridium sp. TaxID=1506 RepID=UPI002602A094|nr:hypothetical protein [Clostridium sp.]